VESDGLRLCLLKLFFVRIVVDELLVPITLISMTLCISTKDDGYILRMGAGDLKAQVPGMGGTLDAIRERMKSIQAAAAGNTGPYVLTCANGSLAVQSRTMPMSGDAAQAGWPDMDGKALSGLQARMERLKNGPGLDL
jgi:hypothetical protein